MSLPNTMTTTTTLTSDNLEAATTLAQSSSLETDLVTASPTIMDMWMTQLQKDHPEISFVVPSQHDNQHIDNMVQFKRLLEQVGNTAYDTLTSGSPQHHEPHILYDSMGQTITHEQIKNSAVLNMADLKNNALNGLERFFDGTDMHSLINYLWVGVVTSLIVLTVIFVLFSCYFYRKFREWKKCNKDIRAHFNNDMYPDANMPCHASANSEAAYYQVESPPCYTIATGLPTYDEALHHHQHRHHTQQNFAFGMKFIYPTLAAVHHQASNLISSWEKYDIANKEEKSTATTKCKSSTAYRSKLSQALTSSTALATAASSISLEASTATSATSALLLPPSYEVVTNSMVLLPEQVTIGDNVTITMPQLENYTSPSAAAAAKSSSDLTGIITV